MALGSGTRVGSYEIVAAIGAGGMGEVFRARDTKIGRDVALKVLPESVAADPERIARMHREAQLLAALNHPNIAAIYGFEDSGSAHALVLEFVDGETLADRISRGPIPFDEAMGIARQIAEALEEAHEHGIIHRDLKPANIKVTPDGRVKVLDFGLAKLTERATVSSGTAVGCRCPRPSPRPRWPVLLESCSARQRTCRQNRQRVDRLTSAATFGHSDVFCTKSSPASGRSTARM
jgi:serine/threonine protein kinase